VQTLSVREVRKYPWSCFYNGHRRKRPRVMFYITRKEVDIPISRGCGGYHWVANNLGKAISDKLWSQVLDMVAFYWGTEARFDMERGYRKWVRAAGCPCGRAPGLVLYGTNGMKYDLAVFLNNE